MRSFTVSKPVGAENVHVQIGLNVMLRTDVPKRIADSAEKAGFVHGYVETPHTLLLVEKALAADLKWVPPRESGSRYPPPTALITHLELEQGPPELTAHCLRKQVAGVSDQSVLVRWSFVYRDNCFQDDRPLLQSGDEAVRVLSMCTTPRELQYSERSWSRRVVDPANVEHAVHVLAVMQAGGQVVLPDFRTSHLYSLGQTDSVIGLRYDGDSRFSMVTLSEVETGSQAAA